MSDESPIASSSDEEQLAELRNLLLGLEQSELAELQRVFADRGERISLVAEVITEALRSRNDRDDSVGMALTATIEQAMHASIRRDPEPLANAIYPVIGPSIRNAINASIMDLVDALNRSINDQLSFNAIRHRFGAWRAGVPYSEYLLLNNIKYRIEQVFVIHKETGLLLVHLAASDEEISDPDMVSGMLSAIQDFVRESFDAGGEADATNLRSMRTGAKTVHIEAGEYAAAAMVVRGNPPPSRMTEFANRVDQLHAGWGALLASFTGDTEAFSSVGELFEPMLMAEADASDDRVRSKRVWPVIVIALLALAGLFGWWRYGEYQLEQQTAELRSALDAEPGIVVTQFLTSRSQVVVQGLRDTLAQEPQALLENWQGPPVSFQLQPYFAAEGDIARQRVERALRAPDTATLQFLESGVIRVDGVASRAWFERADTAASALPGGWQLQAGTITWLTSQAEKLAELEQTIEAQRFLFGIGESELDAAGEERLLALAATVLELAINAQQQPLFTVIGQSDYNGSVALNRQLSLARAETLRRTLVAAGVSADQVTTTGFISTGDQPQDRHARIEVEWR